MSTVTGQEGGAITQDEALSLISNFKKNAAQGEVTAHLFGRDIIDKVLAQAGCVGIRIYYGKDAKGAKQLVIYGVDKNGDGLVNTIADQGVPCPPYCGRP